MTKLVSVKVDTPQPFYVACPQHRATHFCHKGTWHIIDELRTVVVNAAHRVEYVTTRGSTPFALESVTLGRMDTPSKPNKTITVTLTDRQATVLALILARVSVLPRNKDADLNAVASSLFYELYDAADTAPDTFQISGRGEHLVIEKRPC